MIRSYDNLIYLYRNLAGVTNNNNKEKKKGQTAKKVSCLHFVDTPGNEDEKRDDVLFETGRTVVPV